MLLPLLLLFALPSSAVALIKNTSIAPLNGNFVSAYDPDRALQFVYYSAAAYCDANPINAWSCGPCKKLGSYDATTVSDARTDGQAYVASSAADNVIVVAFRGSENLKNWIANLNFSKAAAYPECNGCMVHGGFYDSMKALYPTIRNEVARRRLDLPTARLVVTGHSLGAALAVLTANELHYGEGLVVDAVYTFGEPRVGNLAFKNYYNARGRVSWRVTHWRDPVPHLPPESFDFMHIATEVWYNNEASSSYQVCDSSGEDPKCSDSLWFDSSVSDHLHYLNISISEIC